jgi:hypothetical protein
MPVRVQLPVASALALAASAWAGPYEDCILQNMKGVSDRAAAVAVRKACEVKTTPKLCRDDANNMQRASFDVTGARKAGYTDQEIYVYLRNLCVKECAESSWWSRTFGDCKTE